jgi:beta-glucosidase
MTEVTDTTPLYRDASRPVPERVADLLGRMTTIEKAAQLGSAWVFQLTVGTDLADEAANLLEHGLGQVTRVSGASDLRSADAAAVANRIQEFLVGKTRLGIPAIVHEEVCAGLMARGATVFPQPIGLASTWDPGLVEEMTAIVRAEMRAVGAHQGLAPVLDVCRDPRWGRLEETFGEDPHLVACMGVAYVRGLQGGSRRDGVVATAKHLVGYGASEGGLNWAPAHIPARELREVYLHPFEAAVRVAMRVRLQYPLEAQTVFFEVIFDELDLGRIGSARNDVESEHRVDNGGD